MNIFSTCLRQMRKGVALLEIPIQLTLLCRSLFVSCLLSLIFPHGHFVWHKHKPEVHCGISKVEISDGLWPLWAYGPHGPRAIFYFILFLFYFFNFFFNFIFFNFIFNFF